MTELGHRACLDLADPLTREVEVLAHLFQGAGLAAVETEPQAQDLALALVERGEQPADLVGQEGDGGDLEGRFGGAVLDHVAELGVAVLAQRLGQREGSARKRSASTSLSSGISTSMPSSTRVAAGPA